MGVMLALIAASGVATGEVAAAQVPAPAPSTETSPAGPAGADASVAGPVTGIAIPALTPVAIEILVPLSSKTAKHGDFFPIRLARSLSFGAGLSVPAGTPGMGQVIDAAKSGFGGRPGELSLAVRYLDVGGVHVPLRSFSFADYSGHDKSATAAALMIGAGMVGGVAALFINGGEVNVPVGTVAFAKTAADAVVPILQPPPPLAVQPERIP